MNTMKKINFISVAAMGCRMAAIAVESMGKVLIDSYLPKDFLLKSLRN